MRGFFSFISKTVQSSKQLLLLFANNDYRSRTSGIINVRPSQRRYWFSTTTPNDVDVEVEVEGRDDELRSSSSSSSRRRVVVEVEKPTTNKHESLLLIPTPPTPTPTPTPCGCLVVVEGEHGKVLSDDKFPYCKHKEGRKPPPSAAAALKRRNYLRKLSTMSKVSNPGPDGHLPANVNYLLDSGFTHDQIKGMVRKNPRFAYCSLDGKIKPFMEFLVELGVPQSGIVRIIFKQPSLCGLSISGKIVPTMTYLESFGINKSQWAKVIHRFPPLLTLSRQKIKACVDFFVELGLSEKAVGKILTQCPSIVGDSVEDNLRPTAQYFKSLGINPTILIQQAPGALRLSIEANLKPRVKFFLDKGFNMDQVMIMISRFGSLCCYSLADNMVPKWEFFLTMGFPNSELVTFPQYFSYSFEGRIKPRFSRMASCGLRASLCSVLVTTDLKFEEMIQKKLKKLERSSQKRDCG